ncbi:MAG: asparagine synthase-related protein [Pseudolabrys sp.]
MSTIFGLLRFDGRAVAERDLERMSSALAHRGPDGRKFVARGPAGLGHCLLRVTHEDLFERQPIQDREAGLTLVADCRLDNRDELAGALHIPAQDLRAMPDSALILSAYKAWGEDCTARLLGDFVFAVWDARVNRLVIARDHMGQRPLLYHRGDGFFAFAGDLKGLWALADVPQRLDVERFAARLVGPRADGAAAGETPFEDIHGVPGASVMTIGQDGRTLTRRYWEPRPDPAHLGRDEAYYIAAYRRVLGEAVNCRLRRLLHPPAMLLSGGYDSAAVAGLAGPVLGAAGRKLTAVASVMPEGYDGTIRHARRWVEMCARDMPHLDVHYYTRDDLDVLAGLERGFIETGLPESAYGQATGAMLTIAARAGARLVMDGQGGDYTLNPRGNWVLAHFLKAGQFRRFVTETRAHLRLGHGWRETIGREIALPLAPGLMALWRRLRKGGRPEWHDRPVTPAFAARMAAERNARAEDREAGNAHDGAARILSTIRRVMDRAMHAAEYDAALRGLRLTRPFHDKRVIELALAIPQDLYVKNGRNRYLSCAALGDVYPPEFQSRWRKNDDEIPDFQRRIKSIEPELLAEIARMEQSRMLAGYIDFAKMRNLFAARGAEDHNSGWEQETQIALSAFTAARYIEWMTRRNS